MEELRTRYGELNPEAIACSLNFAFDLTALGREQDGQQRSDDVVDAYRRVLGPGHPAIAAARAGQRANCDVDPMPI